MMAPKTALDSIHAGRVYCFYDQYRICFTAEGNHFYDVEIVDYH